MQICDASSTPLTAFQPPCRHSKMWAHRPACGLRRWRPDRCGWGPCAMRPVCCRYLPQRLPANPGVPNDHLAHRTDHLAAHHFAHLPHQRLVAHHVEISFHTSLGYRKAQVIRVTMETKSIRSWAGRLGSSASRSCQGYRGTGFAGPLVSPPARGVALPHEVGKPGDVPIFLKRRIGEVVLVSVLFSD